MDYDVAIVGAGIVGLATAKALVESSPGVRLVVVEAEPKVAVHQTGHNSGVIHAGLYYKPGSMKARLCAEGREGLYAFCAAHDIPYERCGKLVVATAESELPALEELHRRGVANGLGVRRLGREEIAEHEPRAAGIAALFVPETGIVDYRRVAAAYAGVVRARGGDVRLGWRVRSIVRRAESFVLRTDSGDVTCGTLVNCAGLQSDRVACMCGVDPGVRIIPFRGEYYSITGPRASLVRGLIYPVPDARYPFLGVHLTRRVTGEVEAGPNAVLALRREGYEKGDFSVRDVFDTVTHRGFWGMATKHWRTAVAEVHRSYSKETFLRSLQRLVPALTLDDLSEGGSGVRAQAVDRTGALVDDFRIVEGDRMVHVLNAPSPAATASLAIGRYIAGRVAGVLV